MASPLCVADASALHGMAQHVPTKNAQALITGLTTAVDGKRLGFPREVAGELKVLAHEHPIWAWADALTNKLDDYAANVGQKRPLMGEIVALGFEHGPESLDNKEGCLTEVGCLCLDLCQANRPFVLATEDLGEHPLRPTMEQIAIHCGWTTVDSVGALNHLGLGGLLN